jgi:hypothetical protein
MKICLPAKKEGSSKENTYIVLERPTSSGGCNFSFQKPEFADPYSD